MRTVTATMWWGDERLAATTLDLAECRGDLLDFGAGDHPLIERDGRDVWLTIPSDADAEVRTANGWRDVGRLRILGAVRPHPELRGAAQVRVRQIAWAGAVQPGVVLTDRVEVRLTRGALTLALWLSSDAPVVPPPRRRPWALLLGLALMLVASSALAATGARRGARLGEGATRGGPDPLPEVRVAALARWLPEDTTKHVVHPRERGARASVERRTVEHAEEGPQIEATPSRDTEGARGPDVAGFGGGLGERVRRPYPSVRLETREVRACRRLWNGGCAAEPDEQERRASIRRALRGVTRDVELCLPPGAIRGPGERAIRRVGFDVSRSGMPQHIRAIESLPDEATMDCMRSVIRPLRFGVRSGPARVSIPVEMRAAAL